MKKMLDYHKKTNKENSVFQETNGADFSLYHLMKTLLQLGEHSS